MHKPCPKSDRKDIDGTFKQLTCPDQALLSPLWRLGAFGEAAINAVDRHNTDGDCKDEHQEHDWQDKCTDVGTFCGIDLFGCNSIDDGLYYCDAIGNDPQLLEVCDIGACVSRKDRNGAARCGDGTCTCAKTGYICGSSFPKTCRLVENSLYSCRAGSKPVLHQKCAGSNCPAGSDACSKDPIDTQCLCQAPGTICGSAFPKKCGLTSGALYVCPDKGEPPKFLEDNSEDCTTEEDDCLCTNTGDCISSFLASCGLKASALYTCSAKGERPVFKQECPSGQCPANAHECGAVPKCVCTEKGDVCGSNFANDCDLKPNSIYSCAGKGERPVFKEECPSDPCRRSTNTCVPARNCLCKEEGTVRVLKVHGIAYPIFEAKTKVLPPAILTHVSASRLGRFVDHPSQDNADTIVSLFTSICGSSFDATCKFDLDTIYYCSKTGDLPVAIEKCKVGTCSGNGHNCERPFTCRCKAKGTPCGSEFPAECLLDPDTKYQCGEAGDRPLPIAKFPPGGCNEIVDPFTNDPCKCFRNGTICGSLIVKDGCTRIPIIATSIYECVNSKDPIEVNQCLPPKVCTQTSEGATCNETPCTCSSEGAKICGAAADPTCGLDPKSTYLCTGGSFVQNNTCTTACDYTKGECFDKCKCPAGGLVCGSTFPGCGLNNQSLYSCVKGRKPVLLRECKPGQCISGPVPPITFAYPGPVSGEYQDTCGPNPCYCDPGEQLVCDSMFQEDCKLQKGSVLSCPGTGGKPVPVETCDPSVCTNINGAAQCEPSPCNCIDAGSYCGSSFPEVCHFPPNSVYSCLKAGSKPILATSCDPQQCISNGKNAECTKDLCKCAATNATVCASSFPISCRLKTDVVYSCPTIGEYPDEVAVCTPEKCVVVDAVGQCDKNPCLCNSAINRLCGSEFPEKCGYVVTAIYSCPAALVKPVLIEECPSGLVCANEQSGPTCHSDLCHCHSSDIGNNICGSTLFDGCEYDDNVIYTCYADGNEWEPVRTCSPGECIFADGVPKCSRDDCICKPDSDGKEFCDTNFPSVCGLVGDSVYVCTAGETPVLKKSCPPNKCEHNALAGTAICKNPLCNCPAGAITACSADFPVTCNYDPNSVYTCTDPKNPAKLEDCNPVTCISSPPTARCNEDPCACRAGDTTVCGSSFPETCMLKPEGTYQCVGNKYPLLISECTPTACYILNGTAFCERDDCVCKDGQQTACYFDFPATCGFSQDSQQLLKCDGPGSKPALGIKCSTECIVDVPDVSSKCKPDICTCAPYMAGKQVCASQFPSECGYLSDKLYYCPAQDVRPTVLQDCTLPSQCVVDLDTGSCVTPVDPCKCPAGKEQTCGSDFDATCGLNPNGLYNCPAVGKKPILDKTCRAGCVKGSGQCTPDPCKCTKTELKCGSAFAPSCMLNKDTLYECKKAGDDPLVKQQCIAGGCVAGTAVCQPDPCKCGTAATTCGKDYLRRCGFTPDTIYTCSGQGVTPQPSITCESGLCASVNGSAICKPDCTCKTNLDTCGVDFPTKCGLNVDTLFTCNNIGDTPVPKEVCKPGACKTGTHQCFVDPCACKSIGQLCGKDICSTLRADTVYICNNEGATPVPSTVCPVGKCNGGKCAPTEECLCTQNGPFCGAELPCPGLNPELYYSCSIGKKPFPFGYCRDNKPTDGSCLCNDGYGMCSTYFPFECGYDQNQVMGCPNGRDTKPVTVTQCGVGRCTNQIKCDTNCKCTSTADVCGKQFDPACNYEQGSTYKCSAAGANPVLYKKCGPADLCIPNFSGARCVGECQCKDVDTACGAAFPSLCGFQASMLYRCDYAGARPESPKSCPVPCNPQNGPDRCGMTEFTGR
ncbi:hypothetical protein BGZ67_005314 [Mortierella alpina]|nr:hypothetical protein BGZ67_005314 [Mortierella alpina]